MLRRRVRRAAAILAKLIEGHRRMPSTQRIAGFSLLVVGLVLLALSGFYYVYGLVANAGLDDLNFDAERPAFASLSPSENILDAARGEAESSAVPDESPLDRSLPESIRQATTASETDGVETAAQQSTVVRTDLAVAPAASNEAFGGRSESGSSKPATAVAPAASDLPGVSLDFDSTSAPNSQDTVPTASFATLRTVDARISAGEHQAAAVNDLDPSDGPGAETGVPGFDPEVAFGAERLASITRVPESLEYELLVQGGDRYFAPDSAPLSNDPTPAVHMVIPMIGVDSKVQDLGIDLTADVRKWESPKWVVGHIPTTARPGGQGEGWYFGHLESPIRGEGNVFSKLPDIPKLLRAGKKVEIILEGPDGKYVYQAYKSTWVEQEDLRITDSGNRDITLVTCYPRLRYDKRLLVTAALVDIVRS